MKHIRILARAVAFVLALLFAGLSSSPRVIIAKTPPFDGGSAKPDDLVLHLPFGEGISSDLRYFTYDGETHRGKDRYAVDFNIGGSTVYPAAPGSILYIKHWNGIDDGYGNYVLIAHAPLPAEEAYISIYAHLASIDPGLYVGKPVQLDTPLGIEGSTGDANDPPVRHLHFALWHGTHLTSGTYPCTAVDPCTPVVPETIVGTHVYEGLGWWHIRYWDQKDTNEVLTAGEKWVGDSTPPSGSWGSGATGDGEEITFGERIVYDVNYEDLGSDIGEIRLTLYYPNWPQQRGPVLPGLDPQLVWRIIARCDPRDGPCGPHHWTLEWDPYSDTGWPVSGSGLLPVPWLPKAVQPPTGSQPVDVCISFDIFDRAGNPLYAGGGTRCNFRDRDNTASDSAGIEIDDQARLLHIMPVSNPSVDNATFLADVTLPDGSVVAPGETLHKVWRVRNSGTSTWGGGYELVFTGGDQMGAPSAVDVPATAPGATADIAIDMTAPSTPAYYAGHWRFRNPQGVYFGDELWIAIQVGTQSSYVSLYFDPPSPSNADHVFIVGTAQGMGDLRAMRILIDGEIVSELGAPEVNADWSTAPYDPGPHTVIAQAARWDDPAWAHPEQATAVYDLLPGPGPVNHCPYRPSLIAPPDYYVSPSGAPTLVAQENGDPDGDPITEYFFEVFDSHDTPNSGWITQNSWTPSGLGMYGYKWHVKVRDSGGKESRWSETRHFLVEDPGPQIYDFHWEWCREAWGGPEKICFCADTNAGTLQLQVNMATDGSGNGEWRIINELGVPDYPCSSDDDRPPNWGQLEAESGTHLARLYARREGGWEAAATADIQVYLPPERRPNPPDTFEPAWQGYVGSPVVHFDWKDSLRTDDYHLVAGVNPDPSQDPLLDVHLTPDTSEYTFTFLDDYETVYWRVTSTGPYGTNDYGSEFHIDVDPPSSTVNSLVPVTYDPAFPVNWSGSDARSGIRWYDVQFRDGERGEWQTWMEETTIASALFRGEAGHTYYFRSRAMDEVGHWEDYPPGDGDTFTLVDPTAAPPTAWWNDDYALKRNLVILNNDGHTMPVHYPVRLHFDSSTTPTAEDMYNASQSAVKGDDFRLVYSNTIELDRQVSSFSPSEIDFWFPLAADLGGGQSSEGQYQLYYINPGAVDPPADVNAVFLPVADENTVGLWHFQEGSGDTVHDTSGRGHDGTFYNAAWAPAFLGTAGQFDGSSAFVYVGDFPDFNLVTGPMTLEAWIYQTDWSNGHIVSKWNEGDCEYFLRFLGGRSAHFSIGTGGEVNTGEMFELNQWYHIAATYDGTNTVRIFVNGAQRAIKTNVVDGHLNDAPLRIGRDYGGGWFPGAIQHVRVSNVARTDFDYGRVELSPSLEAGSPMIPPGAGGPNLVLESLATYPAESGGFVVQAVVRNEGDATTTNGFYSDLYADHEPTGPGDLSGSIRFWIASPIAAGSTITLTTLLTDLRAISGEVASSSPLSETTVTLYSQTDSEGAVTEPDDGDNISAGVDVCTATADSYEDDDEPLSAAPIAVGETQSHNFDSAGDTDWLKFTAEVGMRYTMRTANLGSAADTYLYLYDTDGSTLLAANDDYGGTLASRLEWTAPAAGTYYLLVKHWNPGAAGCGTSYSVVVNSIRVYLPLVVKRYQAPPPDSTSTPTCSPTPTRTPTPTPTHTPTPTPSVTPVPGWHLLAFSGVGVLSAAFSPEYVTDRTILVGTATNVYRSTDGGADWDLLNTGAPASFFALAFSPDYVQDHTIFAGGAGVQRSSDSGATWQDTGTITDSVRALVISSNYANDHTLYAGTVAGHVYRSVDGGDNWIDTGFSVPDYEVRAMAISPDYANDHTVFVGMGHDWDWYSGGVHRSTDGGITWEAINNGLTYQEVHGMAISPNFANDHTLFVAVWAGGVYRSADGGNNWSAANNGITNDRPHVLATSPNYTADRTIFLGTWGEYGDAGVFRSTDGGDNWAVMMEGLDNRFIHCLAMPPNFAEDPFLVAGGELTHGGGLWIYEF